MKKSNLSKLSIGNVTLPNNLILAPMAGVTDLPFRVLCCEQGAGLLCTEMVSAKAIFYNNKNTESLLEISPEEKPVSLQLFGSDPDIISQMAARIEERPFDILDINMGCPVPKVVNNGEGSALMKNPRLVGEIIEKTVRVIKKPVTVKIRKGYTGETVNAVEIAHIAAESGASAVTVHGRTRSQFYTGKADWDIIAAVKNAVRIPVIGNGDVTCGESAAAMFKHTGCDGVMIGRAVRGNPWIFRQIAAHLTDTSVSYESPVKPAAKLPAKPTVDDIVKMIRRHADLMIKYKGEYIALREMRKHTAWYTAGLPHSAELRRRACTIENIGQLEQLLSNMLEEIAIV
ncbi:MAG: tRNA dihydrouridine synthase DusB [Lachnospiraceae bacterium]|nr:tRNA dihydrouridine synthase DusB [Lachnospiraceae bacterium]